MRSRILHGVQRRSECSTKVPFARTHLLVPKQLDTQKAPPNLVRMKTEPVVNVASSGGL